jgi:hypothetical protein
MVRSMRSSSARTVRWLGTMVPDSVSAVGGASAPADGAPVTAPTTSTTAKPAPERGEAFGDALKVARGASSSPAPTAGAMSTEARARAKQLGLGGGAAAYDVLGHRYTRVEGGSHDGRYVNTSGNARNGRMFEIVQRGEHTYHVYEDQAVRVSAAPAAALGPASPQARPSGGSSASPEVA